jgi:hypothetical protein
MFENNMDADSALGAAMKVLVLLFVCYILFPFGMRS